MNETENSSTAPKQFYDTPTTDVFPMAEENSNGGALAGSGNTDDHLGD